MWVFQKWLGGAKSNIGEDEEGRQNLRSGGGGCTEE